jgi:hypothetical protein
VPTTVEGEVVVAFRLVVVVVGTPWALLELVWRSLVHFHFQRYIAGVSDRRGRT